MPPAAVPSGMRTSRLRGGASGAGVADAALVAAPVVAAPAVGTPGVALALDGLSESGAGCFDVAAGGRMPLRSAGRRFVLVETKPVLLAPNPGGLPKLGRLVSGSSALAAAPTARVSR